MSYGRRYYGGDDDVREKTVPKLPAYDWVQSTIGGRTVVCDDARPGMNTKPGGITWIDADGEIIPDAGPDCCVCGMPMRDEKPCHWIGDEPMHKDCVGPSIHGVRKA